MGGIGQMGEILKNLFLSKTKFYFTICSSSQTDIRDKLKRNEVSISYEIIISQTFKAQ